jgi:hypothetical protein
VQAADGLGNLGPVVARGFTVDAAGPVVTIDPLPGDRSGRDGRITYRADESATFECSLDDEGFAACAAAGLDFEELDAGEHALEVRATDAFGNVSAIASYAWTILPVVHVTVYGADGRTPAAGVKVYAKGPSLDGLPTEATTDAGGRVDIAVAAGGSVTAVFGSSSAVGFTVLGVQPFDEITLGKRPIGGATPFGIERSLPAPPAGATCSFHSFGEQRLGCASDGSPSSYFVSPLALDSTGRVNMLVSPSAGPGLPNDALAFGWVAGIAVAAGATVPVTVDRWLAPVDRTVRLLNVPADGALLLHGVGLNGLVYEDGAAETRISGAHAAIDVPLKVPPAGVGQGPATMVTSGRGSILADSTTIDAASLLPPSTILGVSSDPGRTRFTVTSTGPTGVDGMVTVLSWNTFTTPNSPISRWTIVHPPGTFTAPLFTGLSPGAPSGTVNVSQLAIEVSSWDARRFRRDYPILSSWRRLFEINGGAGPDPYLGPGVVGRVTHTVVSLPAQ